MCSKVRALLNCTGFCAYLIQKAFPTQISTSVILKPLTQTFHTMPSEFQVTPKLNTAIEKDNLLPMRAHINTKTLPCCHCCRMVWWGRPHGTVLTWGNENSVYYLSMFLCNYTKNKKWAKKRKLNNFLCFLGSSLIANVRLFRLSNQQWNLKCLSQGHTGM